MATLPESLGKTLISLLPPGKAIIRGLRISLAETNEKSVSKVFTALYLHFFADELCLDLSAGWTLAHVILP